MSPIQLEKLSKDCNPESEGDLLGWNKISDQLKSLSTVSIDDQNDNKICNPFTGKIIQPFSVQIDFDSMQKACQKLGGQDGTMSHTLNCHLNPSMKHFVKYRNHGHQ